MKLKPPLQLSTLWKVILAFTIVNISYTKLYAQKPCECINTNPEKRQHRSKAKYDIQYDSFKVNKNMLTLEEMYEWQERYTNLVPEIIKDPKNEKSYRKRNSPEDTLYTLKGYMYFVKLEQNDCDMHIEIGPADTGATRMIVEVTKYNPDLQFSVQKKLAELGFPLNGCAPVESKKAHFPRGIPVVVTGVGFYDASHKPNDNHGDAHTRKYSWELHPVKDIIFLKEKRKRKGRYGSDSFP